MRICCAAAAAVLCAAATAEDKPRTLEEATKLIAADVAEFVRGQGFSEVLVDDFKGPSTASSGRGLRDMLRTHLKDIGLGVPKVDFSEKLMSVEGDFASAERGGRVVVLIKAHINDAGNNEQVTFQERVEIVDDSGEVAKLLGVTADLSSADPEEVAKTAGLEEAPKAGGEKETLEKTRAAAVSARVKNPKFFLVKNEVAASEGGKLRIEVIRTNGGGRESLPVSDASGFALADLSEDDTYAVRLVNDSAEDVGVELLIDGLNSLMFSSNEGYRKLGKWMIPANSSGVIRGWHLGGERLSKFVIRPTPESELARLGKPTSEIGTITAIFYPAWVGDNVPEVERTLLAGNAGRGGTARGPEITDGVRTVKRTFGKTQLAIVSVRYVNPEPPEDTPR